MNKKRLLFVDDEPNVLQGLRRMLRPLRDEWEMTFADSGSEALRILEQEEHDVLVTDMRMPGMDGAQLLAIVAKRRPRMVRIVLSGYSDQDVMLRSTSQAHQYLAKPCDADTLRSTLARAFALRDLLNDNMLMDLVSGMESVPSLPSLYAELVEELKSPEPSIQNVSGIISKDIGMSAKILKLVNSAFFGLRRQVADPGQATKLLGIDTMKSLVLSIQVFSHPDLESTCGLSLEHVWQHCLFTGALAKKIAMVEQADHELVENAFMAGLLHGCGHPILACNCGELYHSAWVLAQERGISFLAAQQDVFGATHAAVGAYLLGLWGLSDPVVEAVAFHHTPSQCPGDAFSPLTAVHVACCLDAKLNRGSQTEGLELDGDYLRRLGLSDRVRLWVQAAKDMCSKAA